ncbi:MAG: Primosomal protein N' [candidate division BRC1 bacterium ADurb.BinA364]|nr:MAG: Primosomal protein N' [candidate division BRC1 bacterium ADurb.BinA364]
MERHDGATLLLQGVTGSGKTEVYLQAIAEALRQGRQAIVLTPEIALTPQLVDRFRARFGEIVGVYHHRQTLRQKFDLWRRIQQGEIKIVIGARSALFAPFPALGVIVVDEEHTSSYKQNVSPRYHARDVALVRGRARRAAVILGSATPSLESYYNARAGKHTLLDLPERASGVCAMPSIELIDMARELRKTHASPGVLSARLKEAIDRRLERREQSLLLLNRRGYASISVCLECEAVENCPDCSASMTYHKTQDCLVCHLCGMRRRRAEACPACGSREMELVGLGTQKVEEAIRDLFPQARIIRLDSDSARGRTAWIDAWRAIEKREYDLILGTQMVAKGLHLEGLTLVGIVSADTTLFQPDFRAGERTFSLLSQAAGRAGRGDEPGEVIIQSYSPGHYAIQLACRHDYAGLYEQEMRMRRPLRFPPVERLISILVSAEQPETAMGMAKRLDSLLRNLARQERFAGLSVLGPAPCPIERVRGRWRWRLLARGERPAAMHAMARAALEEFDQLASRRKVEVTVDVDPQDLL